MPVTRRSSSRSMQQKDQPQPDTRADEDTPLQTVAELQAKVAVLERQKQRLIEMNGEELQRSEQQRKELNERIEFLENLVDKKPENLKQVVKEKEELEKKMSELTTELEETRRRFNARNRQFYEWDTTKKDLEKKVIDLTTELIEVAEELNEESARADENKRLLDVSEKENEELKKRLQEMEKSDDALPDSSDEVVEGEEEGGDLREKRREDPMEMVEMGKQTDNLEMDAVEQALIISDDLVEGKDEEKAELAEKGAEQPIEVVEVEEKTDNFEMNAAEPVPILNDEVVMRQEEKAVLRVKGEDEPIEVVEVDEQTDNFEMNAVVPAPIISDDLEGEEERVELSEKGEEQPIEKVDMGEQKDHFEMDNAVIAKEFSKKGRKRKDRQGEMNEEETKGRIKKQKTKAVAHPNKKKTAFIVPKHEPTDWRDADVDDDDTPPHLSPAPSSALAVVDGDTESGSAMVSGASFIVPKLEPTGDGAEVELAWTAFRSKHPEVFLTMNDDCVFAQKKFFLDKWALMTQKGKNQFKMKYGCGVKQQFERGEENAVNDSSINFMVAFTAFMSANNKLVTDQSQKKFGEFWAKMKPAAKRAFCVKYRVKKEAGGEQS